MYRIIIENDVVTKEATPELDFVYHSTIKKVSEDYEKLSFNTAISQMMIFINEVYRVNKISQDYAEGFVKIISPIVPHLGEEMWHKLGHDQTIAYEPWPTYNPDKLVLNTVTMGISVNGKLRGEMTVGVDDNDEVIQAAALEVESVKRHIEGKRIVKIIVVKGRLVNIVVA